MDHATILRRMQSLIGKRFRYHGQTWALVDVLDEEGGVVLRNLDGGRPIQADQFGRASRRADETWLVPVFSADGDVLSEDLTELLAARVRP